MTASEPVLTYEVLDAADGEIVYPLAVSLYADTKKGKTFFAASFPNAVLIDFPPVKLSFGKAEIELDKTKMHRNYGEGFPALYGHTEKGWQCKIPNFNRALQYHFPTNWEEFQVALEKAAFFAEDVAMVEGAGRVWVILDDTYRWRGLEILHYLQVNKRKWPSQQEFGLITQAMSGQITKIQNFANVVLVHRMTRDFETQTKVPMVYPSGADFNSDVTVELTHDQRGGALHQVAAISSDRHDFPCGNAGYQAEVIDPTPIKVLTAAKIPKPFW